MSVSRLIDLRGSVWMGGGGKASSALAKSDKLRTGSIAYVSLTQERGAGVQRQSRETRPLQLAVSAVYEVARTFNKVHEEGQEFHFHVSIV